MRNQKWSLRILGTVLIGISLTACPTQSSAMPGAKAPGPSGRAGNGFGMVGQTNGQTPAVTVARLSEWLQAQLGNGMAQQAIATNGVVQRQDRSKAVRKLVSIAGPKVKLVYRNNGTPSHIMGGILEPAAPQPLIFSQDRRVETARNFLRVNRKLFLLNDPDQELKLVKSESDSLGRGHLLFQQVYQGLPVWPCYLTVHLDQSGNVDVMDGAFVPTPDGLTTNALISAEAAIGRALQKAANGAACESTTPKLVIYAPLDERPKLAWKFDLTLDLLHAWQCLVSANDGAVLSLHSLIQQETVTGSGLDATGTSRTLHVWHQGSEFYTVDTSKPMYNPASVPPSISNTFGAIFVMDAANQPPSSSPTSISGNLSTSTSASSGWVPDAVGAAFGLSETFDYYQERHSRNSLDGAGGSIMGYVRVGVDYQNAAWITQLKLMIFGQGYPSGLDVCGHELTHGVVSTIAGGEGLAAGNQPGALNEAIADIFGESIEARTLGTNDWLMGENIPIGAIRNLADPAKIPQGGIPSPSKMSQFAQLPDTQEGDYGGVHLNSTIISHCFYLLVQGMDSPINRQDGERIFYRALTVHMQPQTQFIDVRHACITSAEELFGAGSTQAVKTGQAFDAVELVDAPATPAPPSLPPVASADSALFLRWDPLFSEYDIYRVEAAAGDANTGTLLFLGKAADYKRISVSGDGSEAFFVAADHDYGVFKTDGSGSSLANQPGTLWSMALTPDGNHFAGVLLDSSGQPTKNLFLYDNNTSSAKVIQLYAPANDGKPLDIIQYADTMDFTSDGRFLIYDAYAQIPTTNGTFAGWTMYALEVATTNISQLITLNARYDFGNPCVGKTRNNLITFEVRDNQTGISSYQTVDIFSGKSSTIGQNIHPGALGFPDYTGNDQAIVYSQFDAIAGTGASLFRIPLATDGLTTNGPAALLVADADLVTMYRRGTFVSSNDLPAVTVKMPVEGQVFAPSAPIEIQVTATDTQDGIAAVEFYLGSTKLLTVTNAPYDITITSGLPPGQYYLSARAIDELGAATDSTQVAITVRASSFQLSSPARLNDGTFEFTLNGNPGASYVVLASTNLLNWSVLGTVTNVNGTVTVQDPGAGSQNRRFYRALLQ